MRRLIVCGKEMGGVIAALVVLTALSFPFLVSGAGEEDELIFCEENSDCPANGRCFLGICLIQEDSSPRSGGVQVGGRCGDGVLNMNEECDPPNEDSCGFDELGNIVLCCKTDCTLTQCSDDGDNDGDLKRDCDDPGCWECPRCALEGQRSDCNLVDDQELDPCTNPNIPAQMIEADLKLGDVLAGGGIQLKEYNSLLGRLLAKGGGVFAQFCIDRGFTPIIRGGVCNTCACPKSSGKSMRPMSASDALRTGSRHLDFRCEDGGSVPQTCGESAAPECGGSCSVGETCHSTDGICSCMSLCTPGEDFPECPLINEEGCYGFGQNCESGSLCCTPKGIVEMVGTHGCCSNFYQCGKTESKENICVQCETDQECLSEPALYPDGGSKYQSCIPSSMWPPAQCVSRDLTEGPCRCVGGLCRGIRVSRVCPDGEDESILSEIERDQVPPQVGSTQDSDMPSKAMNDALSQMLEGATGGDSTMLLNQALIEALLKEAADSADETDDVLQRDNRRSGQLDTNEIPSMPVSEVHSTKSIDSLSLPELKVPNCGNGFIQRGEDCGEPGLTCPAGLLCNEKTCRCGTCMACQRCGEGVFSQCDRDSCIALGPCAYERDPEDKEGTCSPHPVLCEDIPDACLTCTQCGVGILNICDRDECEEGWGRGVYCTFTKGMPFVNVGDCKPKQSLCSGS